MGGVNEGARRDTDIFLCGFQLLTHLPLHKVVTISPTVFSDALIKISIKFIPKSPIYNNPSLMVQIVAWRLIGDKTLSELMLTRFTDVYMRHYGKMR